MTNPTYKFAGRNVRWLENAAKDAGLRDVGSAHELCPRGIRHTGWYLDDDIRDETVCGYVWKLATKGDNYRFVAGMFDPWNPHAALIEMTTYYDIDSAAYAADSLAKRYAEDEREHAHRSRLEFEIEERQDAITDIRAKVNTLAKDWREASATLPESLCTYLRERITAEHAELRGNLRRISKLRAKLA